MPRLAHCGRFLTADYTRVHAKDGTAYYCDVQTCGSVWVCPVCSATIRQRRSVEVERVAVEHLASGGSLGFMTVTFAHERSDDLSDLLPLLMKCWERVQQRRGYRALADRLGLVGFVRATEVTYGAWHGWHPHLHMLLFSDLALTAEDWEELRVLVSSAWADVVVKKGRKRPDADRGVTLAPVYALEGSAASVGKYLTKVQDAYGVGKEMTRGDLKKGRKNGRTPFELAESAVAGCVPELPLWWEYERATKGKAAITMTPALRARYAVEDLDDEDLAKAVEDGEALGTVSAAEYGLLVRHGCETFLLDLAVEDGWSAVHRLLVSLVDDEEDA